MRKNYLLFFALAILLINNVVAQNLMTSGIVKSQSDGLALPGVTVHVKGTTLGTVTDVDGKFSLDNVAGDAVLVFSFVGMKTQEIPTKGKTLFSVVMEEDAIGLEEVVAIGYGTMKKSDLTGSVASVKSDELVEYPSSTAMEAVQGKAAGVTILNKGGQPGGYPQVLIRGATSINASSSPLIVVDGFPGGVLPSPQDIASIEILKDASSTAIYGSQGANGVIMVTTKKGASGTLKVEFSGSHTIDAIKNTVEVLDASEFGAFMNEVTGSDLYPNPSSLGEGTNWVDEITRTGSKDDYNISISGNTDKVNYYVSGRYFGHKGTLIRSNYTNYSMRGRLDFKISEKLKVSTSMQLERGIRENTIANNIVPFALKYNPAQGIYNEDGTYTIQNIGDPIDNPYATIAAQDNENTRDLMSMNSSLEYEIIKGLTFKSVLGLMSSNYRTGSYTPSTIELGANSGGIAKISTGFSTKVLSDNYLNYDFQVNEIHKINLMAGTSYQFDRYEYVSAGNSNFITDSGLWWNLGSGSVYARPGSGLKESEMMSYFGRANYSFADKYLITINARYDGSSKFGDNNKWAFFPSGAVAWNVKNEPFLENVENLSQFKIRASYGVTGNTAISEYGTLARFSSFLSVVDGSIVNAVTPSVMANKDLSWESTTQLDVGTDLVFWDGKLRVTADYYKMETDDLLYSAPVVKYSGYSSITLNYGSTENKGYELTLGTDFDVRDLKWSIDLNASRNENKVTELPGNEVKYSNIPGYLVQKDATQILQEGAPVGSFYGYVFDGLYQAGDDIIESGKQPGDIKYRDLNGDGKINTSDREIIGNPHPDLTVGFTNRIEYSDFELSFFFNGVFGNDIYNFTTMSVDGLYGKSNVTTNILNRWTPENTDTDVPRADGVHAIRSSTRWIEDGSYVRLKNLTLAYNLPEKSLSKLGISKCKISLSGQNLLTFTNYSGFDPEVSSNYNNKNVGLDYNSYPNVRSYTLGVNIIF